jgi:hypothetical protein
LLLMLGPWFCIENAKPTSPRFAVGWFAISWRTGVSDGHSSQNCPVRIRSSEVGSLQRPTRFTGNHNQRNPSLVVRGDAKRSTRGTCRLPAIHQRASVPCSVRNQKREPAFSGSGSGSGPNVNPSLDLFAVAADRISNPVPSCLLTLHPLGALVRPHTRSLLSLRPLLRGGPVAAREGLACRGLSRGGPDCPRRRQAVPGRRQRGG